MTGAARSADRAADPLDRRILELLATDARATYAAIGAEVGLSVTAVKRRIDRLRADGILVGFTVILDPVRLGWRLEVLVSIFTNGVVPVEEMRARLAGMPEVVEALTVTGQGDTLVRVVTRDTPHLEQVVGRLRGLPHVLRTESTVVMTHLVDRRPIAPA